MIFSVAISKNTHMVAVVLLVSLFLPSTGAQSIGVCNGQLGDNLPSDVETVQLYKSNGIGKMRLYSANQATLQALRGSNIELILDVSNPELQGIASDASIAAQWVQTNVKNYFPDVKIKYIAVGNEVDPNGATSQFAQYVLPAMQNIQTAIQGYDLQDQIKVSTASYSALLDNSYPPSNTIFKQNVTSFIKPIISFLVKNNASLLCNLYPYFGHIYNPTDVPLSYALSTSKQAKFQDGGLEYQNLFDAMVDGLNYAVEKAGGSNVDIVVSESGWPSAGSSAATTDDAATYYKNLIKHVKRGTPKKPGKPIETYLFAMFDENQKTGEETERHFGLFNPTTKQPKYQISFT